MNRMQRSLIIPLLTVLAIFVLFNDAGAQESTTHQTPLLNGGAAPWAQSEKTDGESVFSGSRFQNTPLAVIAKAGEQGGGSGACHAEDSIGNCARCCKEKLEGVCMPEVVPRCHEGKPSHAEFKHCARDRTILCQNEYGFCTWQCRLIKKD